MNRPVYRRVDNRFMKVNPDGSLIEINFDLVGCDVAITSSRNPMVKLPDSKFVCSKHDFEKAYKFACDINRAIRRNQSQEVKIILNAVFNT